MGLESLLIFACLVGNSGSCTTSGKAYYMTTHLPEYVEQVRKENRNIAYGAAILSSLFDKRASVGVGYNVTTSVDFTQGTGIPYVRWNYSF